MSPQETSTRLVRSPRFQHLSCTVLIIGLFAGPLSTGDVSGAEEPADPYDVLYDVLMTRRGADGKSYARDETAPSIYGKSHFPFESERLRTGVSLQELITLNCMFVLA